MTDIELRFTPLDILSERLNKCGLEMEGVYGDFDKNPFLDISENIILICKVRLRPK